MDQTIIDRTRLLAEKVMGWKVKDILTMDGGTKLILDVRRTDDGDFLKECWNPYLEGSAAFDVVFGMEDKDFDFSFTSIVPNSDPPFYEAWFEGPQGKGYWGELNPFEAICNAALDALGLIEKEE